MPPNVLLRAALTLGAAVLLAAPAHGDAAARRDGRAPATTLSTGPRGTVAVGRATFGFSSDERSSTFQCRLDRRRWAACRSPRKLTGLSAGRHVLRVRARDRAGNVDATPASRTWTVVPPSTSAPSAPSPTAATSLPPAASLLSATFAGADGVVASSSAFWDFADLGLSENRDWFAESGTIYRRSGLGWADDPVLRIWSRRTDLAFTRMEMDVRFNGWAGGTEGWHGINLWLNRKLRTPAAGTRISDGPQQEGYTVDFLNRDGRIYIQKKVGDDYLILAQRQWSPAPGTWYRWGGRVVDNGNGTSTVQVLVNGAVVQQVTDDGSVGGPRLLGGRVGLRGDYANFNVNGVAISR
jgi:hypothetical protein